MNRMRIQVIILLLAAIVAAVSAPLALAASRQELERDAASALQSLYANNTAARLLGEKAKAVLVFPSIVKAGFMFGGQMGDGVLMKNGRAVGYYNSLAASYGLQAGVQVFGYALFFMNDAALSYLDKSDGWEIGVGPSIVVVDAGRRQVAHQHDDHAGRLCLHLRSEGTDGRPRHSGLEDHEDPVEAAQRSDEKGANTMFENTHLTRGRCDPRPVRRSPARCAASGRQGGGGQPGRPARRHSGQSQGPGGSEPQADRRGGRQVLAGLRPLSEGDRTRSAIAWSA